MNKGLFTRQETDWALSHDWAVRAAKNIAQPDSWALFVRQEEGDTMGHLIDDGRFMGTFEELKAWAGY